MVRSYHFEGLFRTKNIVSKDLMVGSLGRDDHPLSVVIVSTDPTGTHKAIKTLNGRNIRVTVEILNSPAH